MEHNQNQTPSDTIYFWKPNEPWGLFSQWYTAPMTDPETGIQFNCCEQYMMYHKAVTFNDEKSKHIILNELDPREHKKLGRMIKGFTKHKWDEVKFDVVVKANMLKFTQAKALEEDELVRDILGQARGQEEPPSLRSLLLATGDRKLVEASSQDRVWGIGFTAQQAEREPRYRWGKNLLGKALMEVRTRLREEEQMPDLVE